MPVPLVFVVCCLYSSVHAQAPHLVMVLADDLGRFFYVARSLRRLNRVIVNRIQ
jgi:hypothetical protein